jgi:hypothetical protein
MTYTTDDNIPTCRYCLDTKEPLVSPCRCIGTQAYIHRECQEQAYNATGSYTCPVCMLRFKNAAANPREYIASDETDPSLCNLFFGYFLPIFNVFLPMSLYPLIMETAGLVTYQDRALLFALFELSWQGCLVILIFGTNIGFRVKHRYIYAHHLLTTTTHNYIAMHMILLTYLTAFIWRADNPMYQLLLIASQCITHMYETQHEYILKKINEGLPRVIFLTYNQGLAE